VSGGFWDGWDATLDRIRTEKPQTAVGAVAAILNAFGPPSSGVAFAHDKLPAALEAAGWDTWPVEGDYVWQARSGAGEWLHYVEGDVYPGRHR
jgi:hypothetical protein